ncbi:MAG TPA: hypothetical protein PLV45_18025, partial [bacterium]|nr:hypothetical protein [bacterium]
LPGSGDSTAGGAGGNARGIHDVLGEQVYYRNNLIRYIDGGDGATGGAPMMVTSCSRGGHGGPASGLDIENGVHFIRQNTVDGITGGNGGNGGQSYWPETPAPTPTPPSGYVCCGSGGNGGDAVGIRFPHCEFMERYKCNIVTDIHGGMEGVCFTPVPGEGVGMEKLEPGSMEIDFNNVWNVDTDLYRNMSPGPSAINADPLYAANMSNDRYLSQVAAGQTQDSPCVNAGDEPANLVFPPDVYTTRTDEEDDEDNVDLGFHYRASTSTTPTPTGTMTPTTTPTTTPTHPTWTPTPPTWTPTSTPTLSEHPIYIDLEMPKTEFVPDDLCFCRLTVNNIAGATYTDMRQFVILDVTGSLYFAPSFTSYDYYSEILPPGETLIEVLPEFPWPHGCGTMNGVFMYAAVTDSDVAYLVSNLEILTFGWTE